MRADLHNEDISYRVMYEHILHLRWPNIVAAFEPKQLEQFYARYQPC